MRWMKKGIPAVHNLGEAPQALEMDAGPAPLTNEGEADAMEAQEAPSSPPKKTLPPKEDEFIWMWKPELETSRKTFFL